MSSALASPSRSSAHKRRTIHLSSLPPPPIPQRTGSLLLPAPAEPLTLAHLRALQAALEHLASAYEQHARPYPFYDRPNKADVKRARRKPVPGAEEDVRRVRRKPAPAQALEAGAEDLVRLGFGALGMGKEVHVLQVDMPVRQEHAPPPAFQPQPAHYAVRSLSNNDAEQRRTLPLSDFAPLPPTGGASPLSDSDSDGSMSPEAPTHPSRASTPISPATLDSLTSSLSRSLSLSPSLSSSRSRSSKASHRLSTFSLSASLSKRSTSSLRSASPSRSPSIKSNSFRLPLRRPAPPIPIRRSSVETPVHAPPIPVRRSSIDASAALSTSVPTPTIPPRQSSIHHPNHVHSASTSSSSTGTAAGSPAWSESDASSASSVEAKTPTALEFGVGLGFAGVGRAEKWVAQQEQEQGMGKGSGGRGWMERIGARAGR